LVVHFVLNSKLALGSQEILNSVDLQSTSSDTLAFNMPSPAPPQTGDDILTPESLRSTGTKLGSVKAGLHDTVTKVLPLALRKYRMDPDKWENYAMFVCYGPAGMP
jgi:hypothetical protein